VANGPQDGKGALEVIREHKLLTEAQIKDILDQRSLQIRQDQIQIVSSWEE
jgi:hypothetical protein